MTVNIALFDDLDAVAADAAGALDRAAQPSLFARLAWFRLIARPLPAAGQARRAARAATATRQAWLFLAADGRNGAGLCRLVFAALRRGRRRRKLTS